METNFVILSSIEEEDIALREGDIDILSAARRYIDLEGKQGDFLERVEDRLLSGTSGTIYLKKLGHRALTSADFENIVKTLGSQEDKQTLIEFSQAQVDFKDRLATTRAIGLVLEQADITRDLLYKRAKRPDLWKAQEIIKIMDVLDRMRV